MRRILKGQMNVMPVHLRVQLVLKQPAMVHYRTLLHGLMIHDLKAEEDRVVIGSTDGLSKIHCFINQ